MTGRPSPAPREWVGDAPFPWPPTRSLSDGAGVRACFVVVELQVARTRNDQPYLRLTLSDRFGPVEARVWNRAEELLPTLHPGCYVGVQGRIEFFNGQLQLCVDGLQPIRVEPDDLALFLPRSARPQAAMEHDLERVLETIADPALQSLLQACIGPDGAAGPGFRIAPAAKHNHHAYLGGLLEHTLSVAGLCDRLAVHYGPGIDRDLLLTAALLHDVGKVREIGTGAGFAYTDEGKLLGHILLGLEIVTAAARRVPALDPGRLLLLQHLIAAHQGRYEWQSPREPATLEALILHYADDLDAKLQQVRELIASGDGAWTAYDRSFRREFLRPAPVAAPPAPGAPDAEEPSADSNPDEHSSGAGPGQADAPSSAQKPLAGGGGTHRSTRSHTASNFHRLSEDTLDLFGAAQEP